MGPISSVIIIIIIIMLKGFLTPYDADKVRDLLRYFTPPSLERRQ